MGTVYVEATLTGPAGREAQLNLLVDSGATYTLVPNATWQDLGLERQRRQAFRLADGTAIERDVGECQIQLLDFMGHTPVILGEVGDEALLGMVTLEIFGLVLNPFNRRLEPMRMMLA